MSEAVTTLQIFNSSGLPGLIIGALLVLLCGFGYLIIRILSLHAEERREWKSAFQVVSQQIDLRQKETNEVLRGMTQVFDAINNRNRRFMDDLK